METTQVKEAVVAILTKARDDVRANMQAKRINASGRTSASIVVKETGTGFALVGGKPGTHTVSGKPRGVDVQAQNTAPIPTLEIGRPGGRVPKGFYYIIKEWTREKGLTFSRESERQTFAYFLAKRIARQGTRRHEVPEEVYSTPAKEAAKALQKDLGLLAATEIKQVLTNW